MSNPAVIILATSRGKDIKRLVIEDNIGESIHIHADGLRIDLTIKDLLKLTTGMKSALGEIMLRKGLNINLLDEDFMINSAHVWPYLAGAKIRNVRLSQLKCSIYYPNLMPLHRQLPLTESPAFKYLQGDKLPYIEYCEKSKNTLGAPERLTKLAESISQNGYDETRRPIVIFNGKPLIMDGQHRAACLAQGDLDMEIPILDITFKNRHGIPVLLQRMTKHYARTTKHRIRRILLILRARFTLFIKC